MESEPTGVYVTYTITTTYAKEISLDVLRQHGAPVDDLDSDDLKWWLEKNAEKVELDVLHSRDWVDTDSQSVDVEEIEPWRAPVSGV